jgi:DNA polymerase-3 subunit alpha
MPDFVHLHTHSHYSLLDGTGRIEPLLQRAKELGMSSLALTDHGAMYGILEFYETALKVGIKPILGVEIYVAPRGLTDKEPSLDSHSFHLILLAENLTGYKNLIKIVSEAHLNGFYYKPRTDKAFLKKHAEGIIATSACMNGEIPRSLEISYADGKRALEEYLEIFGKDNFFLELQPDHRGPEQKQLNHKLVELAKECGVGLVATNDVHYIYPEDSEAQDVLICVGLGKTISDPNRLNMTAIDLSMFAPEKMAELFKDYPGAISNTVKIADRCNLKISLGTNILPTYPLPEGTTDRLYLRELCAEGVKRRFHFDYTPRSDRPEGQLLPSPINDPSLPIQKRVTERLEYELSVIEKVGYESYFLIVQDFIRWAKDQHIAVGPGRGSAAGSLVSYLTEITDIDPLFHDLIFERFLNPDRIGMPDIDTDLEDARRDEVIQYTRERFGADHVCQIITFGTMAARNAIRDVGRVLSVPYADCDYLAKLIPSGPGGMTIGQALENIDELKNLYQSNAQFTKLLDIASRLEGVARHTSIHAAGVVISKKPLTEYLPIQHSTRDENSVVTQYPMAQVEHIGLLKMDFLGLANLSVIQQAIRIIRKTRQTEINLDTLPIDDSKTYELLTRAESTGVFQLESAGMKRYLKELKPNTFEDILSMVALYRPGPMDSIPDFINSKHGRKKITYLHPILKPILEKTYGVIVTQDQVLEIARKFAGFSYAEADILRKAVGKKIKKLLDEQRDKFIHGALQNHKITEKQAAQVWDFIEPFARYGFNRAHAACYAMIAYQTAYLKAHYPVEFMASLLTSDTNNLDRLGIEISECKEMGISVFPPNVNESFVEFGAVFYPQNDTTSNRFDSYIRFGLGAIKNVGAQAAEFIVEERKQNGPFSDLLDFIKRNHQHLNKKILENLAMAGALDTLEERAVILHNIETILSFITQMKNQFNSPQLGLFAKEGSEANELDYNLHLSACSATSQKVRLEWERELLGIYISNHPINNYLPYFPSDRQTIAVLQNGNINKDVKVGGIVMQIHKILTKKNESMAFVTVEDETSSAEIIIFPRLWKDYEKRLIIGEAFVFNGKLSFKEKIKPQTAPIESEESEESETSVQDIKILLDKMEMVSTNQLPQNKKTEKLTIKIPDTGTRELLQTIKEFLENSPGQLPVSLLIPNLDGYQTLNIANRIELSEKLYSQLANLLGSDNLILD